MQYQKVIEQLGYTSKEAKVYLVSLALGEAHISDIAAKVKMPRSSVQAIVDRLHDDGLMNFYVMRRYKYWVAEHPERLLSRLEKRRDAVTEALPKLIEMRQQSRKARAAQTTSKDLGPIRSIADEATHAVLITDEEQCILYVNAAWEKIFGYTLSEVYGQTPRVCSSGKTPRAIYAKMWQTLSEGGMFQTDEVIDQSKDGQRFGCTRPSFRSVTRDGYSTYRSLRRQIKKVVVRMYSERASWV